MKATFRPPGLGEDFYSSLLYNHFEVCHTTNKDPIENSGCVSAPINILCPAICPLNASIDAHIEKMFHYPGM